MTSYVGRAQRTAAGSQRDMVWIPAGAFVMGSDEYYPEESPVHEAAVGGFWMDAHPVTVAEFAEFVADTGHVTVAEIAPDAADFPGADPDLLVPGSLVFTPPGPVPLDDFRAWWSWVPGAQWRHPEGPGSSVAARADHPVTHVAYVDAHAYAAWAAKDLPTEAEWEYAARGGLHRARYAWGDEFAPGGRPMANTWQGEFPTENLLVDGYDRTSPVGAFPANGYGLVDMAGNVWEWTVDEYRPEHRAGAATATAATGAVDTTSRATCCAPEGPTRSAAARPGLGPGLASSPRVIKGGSHLCAPNYCLRYRPAARQPESVDTSTSHLGFRCVLH